MSLQIGSEYIQYWYYIEYFSEQKYNDPIPNIGVSYSTIVGVMIADDHIK